MPVRDLHIYRGIYAAAGLAVINRLLKCQASVSGIAMSQEEQTRSEDSARYLDNYSDLSIVCKLLQLI